MKQIILLFSLAFCLVLFSCESKDLDSQEEEIPELTETQDPEYISDPIEIELTSNEQTMTGDNTDFAMKFFSHIYDDSKNAENIVVSPFSMSMALAVLRNGAEGETKQAIQETMGMKDFPESEINAYFKKLNEALIATDTTLSLAVANSVWYAKNALIIKKEFENLSKTWYDAPITGLDYSNMKAAIATINEWCSDNTNGLIRDFFKEGKELSAVEILNALYFKGAWAKGYKFDASKTFRNEFSKSDGQKVTVDMMHDKFFTRYYMDENLILTSLPYGNKAYSMYFVLPGEGKSFDGMTKQLLVPGYWSQCINRSETLDVDIYIPKFEVKYENDELTGALVKMGMGIACSGQAQFTQIAENSNFFVGGVCTKTYIKVEEKGTEAAAVTEIELVGLPGPSNKKPVFPADRPFLFVIRENSTGTILFMGKIGDPTEK